jgi:lipopolysaccharide/colanic/teichoic acid biosynthesis glycosyltransferase
MKPMKKIFVLLKRANFLKRPFDVLLSFFGMVLSSPLWIVFAALIWIGDRGPVFYTQERMGRFGQIFKALKFRSMVIDAEKENVPIQATENDPRVTKIGRYMRKTAMDELPQLINIFKGDMSFVGPRALRPQEKEVNGNGIVVDISQISGFQERCSVRPGLTGLAQIFLPADSPRQKKFRYDHLYIRRQSFCFDIKLICLSFWITFRAKWESHGQKV